MAKKEEVRSYALQLGVDDVGIASVAEYRSPRSKTLDSIFPGARSIIVLAYRELASCESPNSHIALNGRLDLMEFSRGCNYRLGRFLQMECGAKSMTVPVSYPMEMSRETRGTVGEVSLRHAAVAAGLGTFGRHNLVVHPRFGSRVIFSAVLTDVEWEPDPPAEARGCTDCGLCVENCPGKALAVEGRTDVMKCIGNSQPYGLSGAIGFWSRHADAPPEERKEMFRDDFFWRMYQAGHIGPQYFCFRCIGSCPAGQGVGASTL
jgi:epoxyqueuosine reductase QueG